jgi:hypothetical protein
VSTLLAEHCNTVLFGHRMITTFVTALRRDGLTAPMVLDGPMTGEAFLAYVGQGLIPTLRRSNSITSS